MKLQARQLILNRDFEHPADGWYQIESKGKHSNQAAGVVQVIDDQACDAIVKTFNRDAAAPGFPGMLVDHEHFKHDAEKETRAYGWLTQLQNRADGIYGQIRWTGTGKSAVDSGDYRFFSTEYDSSDCVILNSEGKMKTIRPMRLDGLTLTNDNNNKGQKPITNRKEIPPGAVAGADSNAGKIPAQTEPKKMKTVCTLLGLSADASEESVHAAVTSIMNRAQKAEAELAPVLNRATTAENKLVALEAIQIETDLETYKNRFDPGQKDFIKSMIITNRAGALAFLKAQPEIKTPVAPGRIHNRADAKEAAPMESGDANDEATAEKRREAVQSYKVANRCSHIEATNAVRRKSPELFGLTK